MTHGVKTKTTNTVRCLALVLCITLSLAGCSLVRQVSPDEQEAIRQNKKAIVLYRLTGSLDSKEVHLLLENFVADHSNKILLTFGLANLDAAEPVKSFSPVERSDLHFSPSPEAARSGWGAFMLEPGSYYLRITSEAADRQEMFEPVPEFRFVVPPSTPLLYIGSLHLACTTKETASWFGGRDFKACSSRATAANEAEAAKVVAEASFRDFGSPLCDDDATLSHSTAATAWHHFENSSRRAFGARKQDRSRIA